MKRIAILVVGLGLLLSSGGCLTSDTQHNRKHYQDVKDDLHYMHRDIDKAIGTDKPSPLRNQEKP